MKSISTSIHIAAPASRVWKVLTDFPSYPGWNPFIRSISGRLRMGERLSVQIQPPGGRAMRFAPIVLVADPEREMRWKGKLWIRGLFDGEHYLSLEPAGSGTLLHHGESFSGLLVNWMSASQLDSIERGFAAMNEAVKERTERETRPKRSFGF